MKLIERGMSIQMLREMFRLDVETGFIYWIARPATHFKNGKARTAQQIANKINSCHAGKLAFTSKHQLGYLRAEISNQLFQAHRVSYALFHGEWPYGDIDHINGIPSDNRPCNLRDVTHSINMRNSAIRVDNKSGVQGISVRKNKTKAWKWIVELRSEGNRARREFNSLEEAIHAKSLFATELGFHKNHGRKLA